jgi:hypothetical protein
MLWLATLLPVVVGLYVLLLRRRKKTILRYAIVQLSTEQQTIMMVMDVSVSMRATDVAPTRLTASQTAAKAFATELPRDLRIGVVAYAGTAQLGATSDAEPGRCDRGHQRFQLQRGTAIGSGISTQSARLPRMSRAPITPRPPRRSSRCRMSRLSRARTADLRFRL